MPSGNDLIDGGTGADTLFFGFSQSGVTVDLNILTAQDTGEGLDIITGIENIRGSFGNDVLIGNAEDNVLDGFFEGNDTLSGGAGNDTLMASSGNNLLSGGTGNDQLFGGFGDDVIIADNAVRLTGVEGDVYRAFQAVFDRDPDLGGFNAFSQEIRLGNLTQENVIAQFVDSAEFQQTYGNLDNGGFLDQLFLNVFNRAADAGGARGLLGSAGRRTLTCLCCDRVC